MFNRSVIQTQIIRLVGVVSSILLLLAVTRCNQPTPEIHSEIPASPINHYIVAYSNFQDEANPALATHLRLITSDSLNTDCFKLSNGKQDSTAITQVSMINGNLIIQLHTMLGDVSLYDLNQIKDSIKVHSTCANIFVLMSEMPWCNQFGLFQRLKINASQTTIYNESNFWTAVEPIFKELPQQTYFIGGQMGKEKGDDGYTYFQYENISLIGTGTGESKESNVLKFNLHESKEVSIELHFVNNDTVFDLKTYKLPFSRQKKSSLKPFLTKSSTRTTLVHSE